MNTRRNFRQIQLADWPRGLERAIAIVAFEPSEIAARCGLQFERSEDDLDGALIGTPSGKQFALVRDRGATARGTELWTRSDSEDFGQDLREALRVLGLSGVEGESAAGRRAVDDTRSTVLVYRGRPIYAMFTSNAGWSTGDPKFIFNQPLPYMTATPDPYSPGETMGRWTRRSSADRSQTTCGTTHIAGGETLPLPVPFPGVLDNAAETWDLKLTGWSLVPRLAQTITEGPGFRAPDPLLFRPAARPPSTKRLAQLSSFG
jgi:hypothetical protein